jgi:hypothetical protein
MRRARVVGRGAAALGAALGLFASPALAHGGSLRSAAAGRLAVPTWLFLLTGGAAVGASFLLASLLTDRAFVRSVHERRLSLPSAAALRPVLRAVGLGGVVAVVVGGLLGPTDPLQNVGVLLVWVGWWAGFAALTYLVGNAWPALDPARTIAAVLPRGGRQLENAWPAAVGLLVLVYVEVVTPLADRPGLLAGTVLVYLAASLAGAAAFENWFERGDPLSLLFRTYGRLAPVQKGRLALPGSALVDADLDRGEAAAVVALLWGTTFDGLVTTPAWRAAAAPAVDALPAGTVYLLYLVALLAGFGLFYGGFRAAAGLARRTAPTYLSAAVLARLFAVSLVPIAAGYHLAHYLGYFLSLSPALAGALTLSSGPARTLVLPGWFGVVPPAAVLAGHVLGVWVAHGVAFRALPGRLQAVRSGYPVTVAMVAYTTVSLWIVSRPSVTPPGL